MHWAGVGGGEEDNSSASALCPLPSPPQEHRCDCKSGAFHTSTESMAASASSSASAPSPIDVARGMASWDPCKETREATLRMIGDVESGESSAASEEMDRRFGHRLAFGTAGLRGPMGFGTSCMNEAVVIQSTQVRRCASWPARSCTRLACDPTPLSTRNLLLAGPSCPPCCDRRIVVGRCCRARDRDWV